MSKFTNFLKVYDETLTAIRKGRFEGTLILYGENLHFFARLLEALRSADAGQDQVLHCNLNSADLDEARDQAVENGGALFGGRQILLFEMEGARRNIDPLLNACLNAKGGNAYLFLLYRPTLPEAMQKAAKKAGAKVIETCGPWPNEAKPYLDRLIREYGLKLPTEAYETLVRQVGFDLLNFDNELKKLKLLLEVPAAAGEAAAMNWQDYFAYLKSGDLFAVNDLLLRDQFADAELEIKKLVRQGEAPLAVLGVLANFFDTTIRLKSGQASASSRRLPEFIQLKYLSFARRHALASLLDAYAACQEADGLLKGGSRLPAELILRTPLAPWSGASASV